jgi:hypothetical protein
MASSTIAASPYCQRRRRGRGAPKGVTDRRNFKRVNGSSIRLAHHSTQGLADAREGFFLFMRLHPRSITFGLKFS